ncbi:MAG: DUF1566 domain-containing protein [Paludibacteraceae bacterium]|nr:DUF1566 domain-containing protein [Paludibacteraceae bacterium]
MIIRLLTYFTLTFFAVNTFSQSLSMEDLEDWSDVKIEKVQKALRKKKFEMSDVDSSDVWVFNKENEKIVVRRSESNTLDFYYTLSELSAYSKLIEEVKSSEDVKSLETNNPGVFCFRKSDCLFYYSLPNKDAAIEFVLKRKGEDFWSLPLERIVPVAPKVYEYNIGEFIEEEGGVLFGFSADKSVGYILAMEDARPGKNSEWGANGIDVYGVFPFTTNEWHKANGDLSGDKNTSAIISYFRSERDSKKYAATLAAEYEGAGKTDWYLPSVGQLNMISRNKDVINAALRANGGTALAKMWYWSSTEYDKYFAWAINMGSSVIGQSSKKGHDKTRAVRSIPIPQR